MGWITCTEYKLGGAACQLGGSVENFGRVPFGCTFCTREAGFQYDL